MRGLRYLRQVAIAAALTVWGAAAQPQLASEYREYSLPLTTFVPQPNRTAGLLLAVSINRGPVLRLLLDSGADDIVINKKAAERSALAVSEEQLLLCPGGYDGRSMRKGLARSIDLGPLSFRNYPIGVTEGRVAEGLDGVMPLAFFRGFLVRMDLRHKRLELDPYPAGAPPAGEFTQAARGANLLFLPMTLNGAKEGYVLLDTGSSYSAVSNSMAKALRSMYLSPVSIRNGGGEFSADYITPGVRFAFGGGQVLADPVVAMDLSRMSRYDGIEIAGVLGFPDLRTKALTLNYRDSLVQVADAR